LTRDDQQSNAAKRDGAAGSIPDRMDRKTRLLRTVIRLTTKELAPERLLQKLCDELNANSCYTFAWGSLDGLPELPEPFFVSNLHPYVEAIRRILVSGEIPCLSKCRSHAESARVHIMKTECVRCPLRKYHNGQGISVPLSVSGRYVGSLHLYQEPGFRPDADELDILSELGIAIGRSIEASRSRRREAAVSDAIAAIERHAGGETAEESVRKLVLTTAEVLSADIAFVARLTETSGELAARAVAQVVDGKLIDPMTYRFKGTPCEQLLTQDSCTFGADIHDRFPELITLTRRPVNGYVGAALKDADGNRIGVFAALFRTDRPVDLETKRQVLSIFAGRASSELQRMRTEDDLVQALARNQRFFDEDIAGHYVTTPDGRLLEANPSLLRMFGFRTIEEARSANLVDLYQNPEDREKFLTELRERGRLVDYVLHVVRTDGSPMVIRENVFAESDDRGNPVRIRGYMTDITEEYRKEQALDEYRLRLEPAYRAAGLGFLEWRPGEKRTYLSREIINILGLRVEPGWRLAGNQSREQHCG